MNKKIYNPPPDTENASLLIAMDRVARQDGSASRTLLYQEMLNSTLLVPVQEVNTPDLLSPGGVTIFIGGDSKGEKWTAAFTSEDALRVWDGVSPFVRIQALEYFRLMRKRPLDRILINPFRERMFFPAGWVTRRELEMLSDGVFPVEIQGNHSIMKLDVGSKLDFGAPDDPLPQSVVDALPRVTRGLRGLQEIYHFTLSVNEGPAHATLGIRVGRGLFCMSPDKIAREIMARVGPLLSEGASLDVISLDRFGSGSPEKADLIWRHTWRLPQQT